VRTILIRFVIYAIAIFLVTWGLPQVFKGIEPPIRYDDWTTLMIFAAMLAVVNSFIRPILKILALPITCMTAGLFGLFINVVMFFLAATLTSLFGNRSVTVGWGGALIGAIAVFLVSFVVNAVTHERVEA
jgi:putative membrane protein